MIKLGSMKKSWQVTAFFRRTFDQVLWFIEVDSQFFSNQSIEAAKIVSFDDIIVIKNKNQLSSSYWRGSLNLIHQ